ncbi:MAG: pyruvate kinase [Candidatus Omnitrophica bacterium]|nr:pyruvate kinase [Candidatus Omnitrophota bacterium]
MNKTKIVCTIGPSSCEVPVLKKLINAGMNVVRLNGSHNSLDWHEAVIKRIRSLDKNISILLDLPGRKIRTKAWGRSFHFAKGQRLVFTSSQDYRGEGKIPVNHSEIHRALKKSDMILAEDGTLKFKVESIDGRDILCRALSTCTLESGKGLNIPSVKLGAAVATETDKKLIRFAINKGVDWVGLSYVENGEQVRKVKRLLAGSGIGVVSKIENQAALENLESIIEESAALMVDRGDLGAEIGIERISLAQKGVISRGNEYGKPVIVATEMLHSMVHNPHPTKAEVMDISNSILDGASAIMLSAETAVGKNPVAAVKIMRSVANEVEKGRSIYDKAMVSLKRTSIPNAIGRSIYEICKEMPIDKVVCITFSGYAASMVSRYRIEPPIIAVSDKLEKTRAFNLLWGVEGVPLKIRFYRDRYDHILESAEKLWRAGRLSGSDQVIFTAVLFPKKGNKMNFLAIHKISDLERVFKWKKK